MKIIKYFILIQLIGFLLAPGIVKSQDFNVVGGVSLAEDTIPPHPSAVLEVRSVGRGVLVPRMTIEDKDSIENPSKGLIVYVTNENKGLYYYNGTDWKMLRSSKPFYPQGAIIMYNGAIVLGGDNFDSNGKGKEGTKMEGWQLCNGKNGSPDLQNRFIAGIAKKESNHDYGKYKRVENSERDTEYPTHTYNMTAEQLPEHRHPVPRKFIDGYNYSHTHTVKVQPHVHSIDVVTGTTRAGVSHRDTNKAKKKTTKDVYIHRTNIKLNPTPRNASITLPAGIIEKTGGQNGNTTTKAIDNRPPYYVVAFLMRTDGEFQYTENTRPIKD